MGKANSILIAIGGGETAEAPDVLKEILDSLKKKSDARLVVMTVATSEPEDAAKKYNALFRTHNVKHVETVSISQRDDAFDDAALKKIKESDAIFFTGGDQLNVTSLLGGSPAHNLIHEKFLEGFIIAGTSAGAAMMSGSMIISGGGGSPPIAGGVEFAPGMDLISGTIIDTHFSQRSRHGRLLTAVAHHPQALGVGLDERTAIVVRGNEFRVVGEGVVTVVDGSQMRYCDLPYRGKEEAIAMYDVHIHSLPAGCSFNLKTREPIVPALKKLAGAGS